MSEETADTSTESNDTQDSLNPVSPLDIKGTEKDMLKDWAKTEFSDEPASEENAEQSEPVDEQAPEPEPEAPKKRTSIFDEEEKPVEENATPEPEPEPEEVPKGAENWKRAKEKHAAALAEKDQIIADLESKLKDSSSNSPEYQKVLEENKEMRERLGQLDLANSPDFQEKYTIPAQQKRQTMETILQENEVEMSLDQLLSKSGKELRLAVSDVMDELPALDKGRFQDAFLSYYDISTNGQEALSNAEATKSQIASEVNLNQEQAVKSEWDRMTQSGNLFLKPIEADNPNDQSDVDQVNAYNQGIEQVLQRATQMATADIGQDGAAKICLSGAVGEFIVNHGIPRIQHEFSVLQERASKAEAELAKIQKHNPQVNGSKEVSTADKPKEAPKPKTEKEALANFANDLKAAGFRDS